MKNAYKDNLGIVYKLPKVKLLSKIPLLIGELAGRVAYDSNRHSEHECVRSFDLNTDMEETDFNGYNSDLLYSLANVHFHKSVLEHLSITIYFEGMSRGVLQEMVRHRTFKYTIQSTRYTLSNILFAWIASKGDLEWLANKLIELEVFVFDDVKLCTIETQAIMSKLNYLSTFEGFYKSTLSKQSIEYINSDYKDNTQDSIYDSLSSFKTKRNAGDAFKSIVSTNFSVRGVITMDLNNLEHFIKLRCNGAAWMHMRKFANTIVETMPYEYKKIINI